MATAFVSCLQKLSNYNPICFPQFSEKNSHTFYSRTVRTCSARSRAAGRDSCSRIPQAMRISSKTISVPPDVNSPKKISLKYGAVIRKAQEESSSKPVVAILGWNDCKPKHLEKYSSIFEDKGWSTICLPTKSLNTFFRSNTECKKIAIFMAETIKDQTQQGQPVFLYTFSNGGCAIYFYLTEALTTVGGPHFNSINVVGSIFDSCPIKPTIESIPRVQISITENMRNPVLRSLVWYAVGLFLPPLVKMNHSMARFFEDLGKMALSCPQLFLYSKADSLAFCDDIEEHMVDRKAQGVEVFSKCWEDSAHVQHYRKYPDEYLKLLEEFVSCCLNEQN